MTPISDDRKQGRRRAPRTDFATYRRLLTYLRGEGLIVAAVFVCIAFESLFTVMTISSLKPILDLMGDEPILAGVTASAGRQLDFEGSMVESVARFYAGFGAQPVPYVTFQRS